mmetsp:Transcript_104860/g.262661  ORF Transcript_104860/g.262661 Transcript_104860/m.262661 type:complete len:85 (-) Transcript_104860:37-291(-)
MGKEMMASLPLYDDVEDDLHLLAVKLHQQGMPAGSMGVLLNRSRYWANPSAEWNPLYTFANRFWRSQPVSFPWARCPPRRLYVL